MSNKIIDPSLRTGVFEGDLKYGRRNGNVPDRGDYSGPANKPVMGLILVRGRDPHVWKKDPLVKEARKYVSETQMLKNNLISAFMQSSKTMRGNFHLIVGKQRF